MADLGAEHVADEGVGLLDLGDGQGTVDLLALAAGGDHAGGAQNGEVLDLGCRSQAREETRQTGACALFAAIADSRRAISLSRICGLRQIGRAYCRPCHCHFLSAFIDSYSAMLSHPMLSVRSRREFDCRPGAGARWRPAFENPCRSCTGRKFLRSAPFGR